MIINMQIHVPLKGDVSCEHCHTPLEHWGINVIDRDRDEAHVRLAKDAAKAFGETWEPVGFMRTPGKYFPHMTKQAAEYLASRVDHFLFCPYCGRSLEQPRVCETLNGIIPLPKISRNIVKTDADELREFNLLRGCGFTFARALIETQQRLDYACVLAQQVLAEHRKRGAALTAACGADESVRMAREWLASVEAKGDGEA